jgi:transcriptional regulator with XRE-family HTH domain
MNRFSELLREARKRAGLTQWMLGEKVGVADSYISRMETGAFPPPSREVTLRLADATGMSNRPVTLYVSTKDIDTLDRFVFLLEANVAGAEDVKEIRLVEIAEHKSLESEQPPQITSPARDVLAATGTFGAPTSLEDDQGQQIPTFEDQARQILTSFPLPYAQRMIAQQMSLEAIRIICWGLKEASDRGELK